MPRHISPRSTLDNLKREAKRWLKALRADVEEARARLRRVLPNAPEQPTLRDVQHALALEHGLPSWTALKARFSEDAPMRRYDKIAEALVMAYGTGEASAMRSVWDYFGHMRAWDAMRRYVRLDLGKREELARSERDEISIDEARFLVARSQGFESWAALFAFASSIPAGRPTTTEKAVDAYSFDASGAREVAARSRDWDEVIAVMRERQLPGMRANGQMTDALLERFSRLDHLSALDLSFSRGVTDDGLRHLGRLPRLRHLNLAGTGITDRSLAVLRRLPALESIALSWTRTTDAGVAHLTACEQLESVDLTGTSSGDGAIRALAGKRKLRDLRSGNGVTDAGIASLHELPVFRSWHGGEARMSLLGFHAWPNHLTLHGSFSDAGLASLVGLDGLFGLSLDRGGHPITGAALAPLANLPRLGWLAVDPTDESMPFIAALPRLRFLMCQDTIAGDDGFVALSASRSIEYIWGRRCHNLQRRGFIALADIPVLRSLSVSCKNVDDLGLSALPRFPALRELMPMDVPDEGYRHVGQCDDLESLVLMYCRETTDLATQHIERLAKLKRYFASYNRITDRTPEILSGMPSLEEIELDSCSGVTNAGITTLAALPHLRELRLSGMPRVTADAASAFAPRVRVSYSV